MSRKLKIDADIESAGLLTLVLAPLLLAIGLAIMDSVGLEQWVADEIGKFIRLVIEASRNE